MPVAVPRVHPVLGHLAVLDVAQPAGLGVHQHLGEALDHGSQQVGIGVLQVLAQQLGHAHRVGDFHRIFSFVFFGRNLKIDAVVVASGGWFAQDELTGAQGVHHVCGREPTYSCSRPSQCLSFVNAVDHMEVFRLNACAPKLLLGTGERELLTRKRV